MTYLYGDSTESGLTSNFLEHLRDALDFAVLVLQADEKIKAGRTKSSAASEASAAEIGRIERFAGVVAAAIEAADKGPDGSPAATCAARVSELLTGASRQTADAVRAKLAADMGAIDSEDAATREACHAALASFLGPHAQEETGTTRRIALLDTGRYDATLTGGASFNVDWTFDLRIPDGNLWASPVRVERIVPQLEIKTPQVTGWLSKEVKVRPQRIEKHAVTELTTAGGKTTYKLRIEAAAETGFDVEVSEGRVKMTRIGPSEDAAAGPFEVDATDVPVIVELTDKLCSAAAQLTLAKLESATVSSDGALTDFRTSPTFVPIVERLIATLAPVVREVARRSLTPTELVLRRALADNRREEVFVAKATLREKYGALSAPLRAILHASRARRPRSDSRAAARRAAIGTRRASGNSSLEPTGSAAADHGSAASQGLGTASSSSSGSFRGAEGASGAGEQRQNRREERSVRRGGQEDRARAQERAYRRGLLAVRRAPLEHGVRGVRARRSAPGPQAALAGEGSPVAHRRGRAGISHRALPHPIARRHAR